MSFENCCLKLGICAKAFSEFEYLGTGAAIVRHLPSSAVLPASSYRDLNHMGRVDRFQPLASIESMVTTLHKQAGEVDTQAAFGADAQPIQKLGFRHRTCKTEMPCNISEQQPYSAGIHQLSGVVCQRLQGVNVQRNRIRKSQVGAGYAAEPEGRRHIHGVNGNGHIGESFDLVRIERSRAAE